MSAPAPLSARPSRAACTHLDPFSPEVLADPYPFYRWLREESPCHHVAARSLYLLSRYDDAVTALRSPETFSSADGMGYAQRASGPLTSSDPPAHTRLRRMVSKQFTPREVAKLTERVEALVDEALEPLLGAGTVDLVSAFTVPVPVMVIAEMLGVSAERRADFKRWSDDSFALMAGTLRPESREALRARFAEGIAFFEAEIAARRADPDPDATDLISALLLPTREGDHLSPSELMRFCFSLLSAGNETTTNLLANAALAFIDHPAEWRKVVASPDLVPSVVEEVMRYESPVQGFCRTTVRDTEVAGTRIPAGARVAVLVGSANRDPDHYIQPDEFRADRNPLDHVAFGSGVHSCLGAALARLEGGAVLRAFTVRVRSVRLAGDVERTSNPMLRGVQRLPVTIEGR